MEEKSYYKIREVCEFTGENASTLRYWETEFRELNPKRTSHGSRLYTPQDIETIKIIRYLLRTKGMHISMAKEQLKNNRKNLGMRTGALEELLAVRESLHGLLKALNKQYKK